MILSPECGTVAARARFLVSHRVAGGVDIAEFERCCEHHEPSESVILIDEAEIAQIDVTDGYDRSIKRDRKVFRLAVSVKHAELPRQDTTPLTDQLTIHDQLPETPRLSKAKRLAEKESAPSVSTDLGKVADRLRGGAERDIRRGELKGSPWRVPDCKPESATIR